MKLKMNLVELAEFQDWLDKYEEKIKFIIRYEQYCPNTTCRDKFIFVIDEE